MNGDAHIVDLGMPARPRRSGPLPDRVFRTVLMRFRRTVEHPRDRRPIVFDLFGLNAFPKVTMAEEFLDALKVTRSAQSLFFFNASPEFFTSLRQPLIAKSRGLASFQVLPFVLLDGSWKWLGIEEPTIETHLNVLTRKVLSFDRAPERGRDPKAIDQGILRGIVDANPTFFSEDPTEGGFRAVFRIDGLLDSFAKAERQQLTKEFRDGGLIRPGHFVLPSGLHTDSCILTNQVPLKPILFDRIYSQIARCLWALDPNIVVTTSLLSFIIGERAKADTGRRIVHAFGYPFPRPRYGESFSPGDRVFILSDIYSSGLSMNRLHKQVSSARARMVGAMAIVDAHGRARREGVRSSLILNLPLYERESCPVCADALEPLLLDPFSCLPYRPQNPISSVRTLFDAEAFWKLVKDKDVVKSGHLIYNGNHFSVFVETRKILCDSSISRELAAHILRTTGVDFDMILLPKNEGALLLGLAVQDYFRHYLDHIPPLVTCARDHEHKIFLVPELPTGSPRNPSILVLDDGANTGNTLLGLHFAVSGFSPRNIRYITFLDRLVGTDREIVRSILGDRYLPIFHLPIPVYREWDCPICLVEERQAYYIQEDQLQAKAPLIRRSGGPRAADSPLELSESLRREEF